MSRNSDNILLLSDKFPIVLYDGTCRFCNYWVQFILEKDRDARFRFLRLESEEGQLLKRSFPEPLQKEDSIFVVYHQKAFGLSDAVFIILTELGHPARFLVYFVPVFLRNSLYRLVAKVRHKIPFWQKDCILPDEKQQSQFLDLSR